MRCVRSGVCEVCEVCEEWSVRCEEWCVVCEELGV